MGFLEGHVQRIEVGWDDTKSKAQDRLKLLTETKDAWVGYAENNETIAGSFEKAEEEIKKVKKHFNLDAAKEDLAKRQDIFNKSKDTFNASLNPLDGWMKSATGEMEAIRAAAGSMLPEDRVARTMDLQEDIAAKMEVLKEDTNNELDLLPQGSDVPKDAQNFKDELARITKYITDLAEKVRKDCDAFSEDVKFWAEYRTGIKEFTPWLVGAEKATTEGLSRPSYFNDVKALHEKVHTFEKTCLKYLQD